MVGLPDILVSGDLARLIPVLADPRKEGRVASVFLAALCGVPSLAKTILESVGQRIGSRASIACYTEIVFKNCPDGDKIRPDGLIVVDGGRGRTWSCLVEAKIGRSEIDADQLLKYVGLAKTNGIDAIVTISNQFVALPTHSPVRLPKVATRGIEVFHWSWMYLLTEADLLLNADEFGNSEQRFILEEVVRYLGHRSTGIETFDRMNPEWKDLVIKVSSGAPLIRGSSEVEKSVAAWHQESRDMCLLMSRTLRRRVQLRLTRSHSDDPATRLRDDTERLVNAHELQFALDIPDAAAPMVVTANVTARNVIVSMTVDAPKDRQRMASRISWIIRQLVKADPQGIFIKASWPGRATDTQASLAALRENPNSLDHPSGGMVPTSFEVRLIRDLAGKFSGTSNFLEEIEAIVPEFYERAGQYLRAYVAAPPKIQRELVDSEIQMPAEITVESPPASAATLTAIMPSDAGALTSIILDATSEQSVPQTDQRESDPNGTADETITKSSKQGS